MAKTTSAGVFQLPNGMWGFRYAFMLDSKQKDIRRNKDENGNPFKTERAATINLIFFQLVHLNYPLPPYCYFCKISCNYHQIMLYL